MIIRFIIKLMLYFNVYRIVSVFDPLPLKKHISSLFSYYTPLKNYESISPAVSEIIVDLTQLFSKYLF